MNSLISSRLLQTYHCGLCVALSLIFGPSIALLVFHNDFFADPIHVVGAPLVTGYTESSEQAAWGAYWLSSIVVSTLGILTLRRQRPTQNACLAVLIALAALACMVLAVPFLFLAILLMLATALPATVAFKLQNTRWRSTPWGGDSEQIAWTALLLALVIRRYGFLVAMLTIPRVGLAALVATAFITYTFATSVKLRRTLSQLFQRVTGCNWLSLALAGVSLVMLPSHLLGFIPCIVAASLLGMSWTGAKQGNKSSTASLAIVTAGVVIYWICHNDYHHYSNRDLLYLTVLSVAVAISTFQLNNRWGATARNCWEAFGNSAWAIAAVAAIAFGTGRWWSSLTIVAVIVAVYSVRRFSKLGRLIAIFLPWALLVVFLPSIYATPIIDVFHDGQVLSAVWEYESGRTIYSEVFPLRGYHFWICWLGRHVLPRTAEACWASFLLLTSLPIAASATIGSVWTRSVFWGLTSGLMMACLPPAEGGRLGCMWLLAAIVLYVSSQPSRRWFLLAFTGIIAGFAGFDVCGPIVLASSGAAFIAPLVTSRGVHQSFGARFRTSIKDSLFTAGLLVVPFSVTVALTAGITSVITYWEIFIDFGRNLNAFYGIPLTFESAVNRNTILPPLILIAIWNSAGVCLRDNFSTPKIRNWCFISLFTFFYSLRATGRSDTHFYCLNHATVVLSMLVLFEATSQIRRMGIRNVWTDRRRVAMAIMLFSIPGICVGTTNPLTLYRELANLSSSERWDLHFDPYVIETISEDESLWPIENGISNYTHRRRNPTRHAIAFAICTPNEQRVAVQSLRRDPPGLIEWPTASLDDIAVPLRYYIIAPFVYRNYQPSEQPGYLRPTPQEFVRLTAPDESFCFPIDFGRLPFQWGQRRLPLIKKSIVQRELLRPSGSEAAPWSSQQAIDSTQFNYLLVTVSTVSSLTSHDSDWPKMTIQFGDAQQHFREQDVVHFRLSPSEGPQTYLVPIGCSPGWSWRQSVSKIRFDFESDDFHIDRVELLQIDEMQ